MRAAQDYPSVASLADGYLRGTLRPREVVARHLARIARLDPQLGAYQAVYGDDALEAADRAQAQFASGTALHPFLGVPFALKDICDLEGRITTGGSLAMADRVSPTTALIAKRLLDAGAILLGKTKTVECAFGGWGTNQHMGTPWNPWDLGAHRVPGGSSSGTGVAVASGLAPCGVGTDTGGSVRLPAGFCGLVGLKVTEGRLPNDGILPLSQTLDTPGPLARSVRDVACMFLTMDGAEASQIQDATEDLVAPLSLDGMRLGCLAQAERAVCASDVLQAYDAACEMLQDRGATLVPFDSPNAHATQACGRIISAEAWHNHGALFSQADAPLDEDVRARMLVGRDMRASEYLAALDSRARDTKAFLAGIEGLDALLTPSMTLTAPRRDAVDQNTHPGHFTRPVNYFGMCALSVPSGLAANGLPTSLQITARAHAERVALRIGAAFERARDPFDYPRL